MFNGPGGTLLRIYTVMAACYFLLSNLAIDKRCMHSKSSCLHDSWKIEYVNTMIAATSCMNRNTIIGGFPGGREENRDGSHKVILILCMLVVLPCSTCEKDGGEI